MKVDILCPLYNAEKDFETLINGINSQKDIDINRIIFPVTESIDKTLELAKGISNAIVIEVKKSDFSHSLTREKAVFEYAESDVVIFMTQDVMLSDPYAMHNIAECIGKDNVAQAFGRQLTKSKGIEKYTRKYNYPETSYVVSKEDIDRMQIKAFYSSDAFGAYDRNVFVELGGFDGKRMQVSEDMYFSRKAILSGYKLKYCAEAIVTHSHNLTIKQVYRRYYDIGVFFAQNPEFKEYKSINSGLSLAFKILGSALLHFDIPTIFRLMPDMGARYLGKKKGERSK